MKTMKNYSLKIFIVEDDPFFGELVKSKITNEGYANSILIGSSQAFMNRLLEMPDVVIMDFNIDKLNGIDLLRKVKSVNPNIHVIFLSGQEEMSVAINSLKYGAYDYLEKNEASLNKLTHLLERIQTTNQMIKKNTTLKTFKKVAILTTTILLFTSFILYALL